MWKFKYLFYQSRWQYWTFSILFCLSDYTWATCFKVQCTLKNTQYNFSHMLCVRRQETSEGESNSINTRSKANHNSLAEALDLLFVNHFVLLQKVREIIIHKENVFKSNKDSQHSLIHHEIWKLYQVHEKKLMLSLRWAWRLLLSSERKVTFQEFFLVITRAQAKSLSHRSTRLQPSIKKWFNN